MAFPCTRLLIRTSLPSIRSAARANLLEGFIPSPSKVHLGRRSSSVSPCRISSLFRLPVELACAQSLMPLHTAVASARLTSRLSLNSRDSSSLSQDGIDGT